MGGGISYSDNILSIVRYKTDTAPSNICRGLTIKPGEYKIIVEPAVYYNESNYWRFGDNRFCGSVRYNKAFRFFLIFPKVHSKNGSSVGESAYLNTAVIFTPKPGLFDETPPMH